MQKYSKNESINFTSDKYIMDAKEQQKEQPPTLRNSCICTKFVNEILAKRYFPLKINVIDPNS